jgi:AcrR family transcriptional regulator
MRVGQRGGRTRPLRAETRERVMAAAVEVFADRGIAASSLTEIAAAAGLTKGAIYSNFSSKDELVLAIMEEHVVSRLRDAIAAFDAADDLDLAVHDLADSLAQAIHSDAVWQHLFFEYCTLARRDPVLHAGLRDRRREGRAAVARAIERIFIAYNIDSPLTAEELSIAGLAISNGLSIESGIDPDAVPVDMFPRLLSLIVGQPR